MPYHRRIRSVPTSADGQELYLRSVMSGSLTRIIQFIGPWERLDGQVLPQMWGFASGTRTRVNGLSPDGSLTVSNHPLRLER